ncbi:hypothetical protein, partial [Escherichia coli]|uniref:hypothetical protein n=1 Tax=Escherichia coli TaxID=562 RepID=UPI001BAF67EE
IQMRHTFSLTTCEIYRFIQMIKSCVVPSNQLVRYKNEKTKNTTGNTKHSLSPQRTRLTKRYMPSREKTKQKKKKKNKIKKKNKKKLKGLLRGRKKKKIKKGVEE